MQKEILQKTLASTPTIYFTLRKKIQLSFFDKNNTKIYSEVKVCFGYLTLKLVPNFAVLNVGSPALNGAATPIKYK